MGVMYKNPEGYPDPVPYQAISNMNKEQKRYRPMVYICSAYAGYTFTLEPRGIHHRP